MTAITIEKTTVLTRILDEGYGPGAWHGADLKAALADVTPELAFQRPGPERHNIAEIAIHHAYTVRNVRAQLAGTKPDPFVLEGEDWFAVDSLTWPQIVETLESEYRKLADVVATLDADSERFALVLGITCHAVYHAGQVQLIKVSTSPR